MFASAEPTTRSVQQSLTAPSNLQAWCPDPLEGWILRTIVKQDADMVEVEPLAEEEILNWSR